MMCVSRVENALNREQNNSTRCRLCQVIVEPEPDRGSWNMAVDEAMLVAAVERDFCAARVYRWDQATLSLGYFQENHRATGEQGESPLPVVRRMSGGGAIIHHHELTYSCAVPASHPLARAPADLYARVHAAFIALLDEQGVTATMRGASAAERDGKFLCFGRCDANDVLLGEHKILGSAQRRRRGAVLQHGSLLLHRSHFAPEFPGIGDLVSDATIGPKFAKQVADRLGLLLGDQSRRVPLPEDVRGVARSLEITCGGVAQARRISRERTAATLSLR